MQIAFTLYRFSRFLLGHLPLSIRLDDLNSERSTNNVKCVYVCRRKADSQIIQLTISLRIHQPKYDKLKKHYQKEKIL
jgi:hypothetical protein